MLLLSIPLVEVGMQQVDDQNDQYLRSCCDEKAEWKHTK